MELYTNYINMYTYTYTCPYTYTYIYTSVSNGKRKPRRFSSIRWPFAHRTNSLSFVLLLTKKQMEVNRWQTHQTDLPIYEYNQYNKSCHRGGDWRVDRGQGKISSLHSVAIGGISLCANGNFFSRQHWTFLPVIFPSSIQLCWWKRVEGLVSKVLFLFSYFISR